MAVRSLRSVLGIVLSLVTVLSLLVSGAAAEAAPGGRPGALPAGADRPDIVVLLLDDMPQMDHRIWQQLPTIRRLFLKQGVEFTDYIGNDPLCCPGRANLLTGQWSHHHGVVSNDARLFDPTESIATELHELGYWTGIFGKYFNKTMKLADPTPDGWDRSFLFGGAYYRYKSLVDGVRRHFGALPADYSTVQIQRQAIAALDRVKDPARPIFLWLAPYAIHDGRDEADRRSRDSVPLVRDRGDARCADLEPWWTAAFDEQDMSDKPAFLRDRPILPAQSLVHPCESLLSVDRMLGRVLAAFEAKGRPMPLVILTVDNGMAWGAHRWWPKFLPYTTPIPLFIHWPAALGREPSTIDTTVTNVDLAPTLCEIAGCEMGPYANGYGLDGRSFLSVLLARGGDLGRQVVFEEHNTDVDLPGIVPWTGLRTTNEAAIGRWAYTEYVDGTKELYDLSGGPCVTWSVGDPGDPCELTNLAGVPAYADVERRLAATLAARETNPSRVLRAR